MRSRIAKKSRVKHCTYENDAMYFFEDYIMVGIYRRRATAVPV